MIQAIILISAVLTLVALFKAAKHAFDEIICDK